MLYCGQKHRHRRRRRRVALRLRVSILQRLTRKKSGRSPTDEIFPSDYDNSVITLRKTDLTLIYSDDFIIICVLFMLPSFLNNLKRTAKEYRTYLDSLLDGYVSNV